MDSPRMTHIRSAMLLPGLILTLPWVVQCIVRSVGPGEAEVEALGCQASCCCMKRAIKNKQRERRKERDRDAASVRDSLSVV